jgi:hypothetical protein
MDAAGISVLVILRYTLKIKSISVRLFGLAKLFSALNIICSMVSLFNSGSSAEII